MQQIFVRLQSKEIHVQIQNWIQHVINFVTLCIHKLYRNYFPNTFLYKHQ